MLVLLAALLGSLLCARLGLWQLDRAAQKTALFESRQQAVALPSLAPSQLPRTPAEIEPLLHRRVLVEGRWLTDKTVYLENRQMNGAPGFYVVTPLLLPDGDVLLVQRGWLPRNVRERSRLAPFDTAEGTVRIEGRIASGFARLYEFDAAASGAIRQNLNVESYARQTGLPLLPVVLVQIEDATASPDGLLRQWSPATLDVSRHHGYAFQWFALSALIAGLYVWFQLIRPRSADAS
ncbi:MAG: SURF1 family protein [Rubrivivax sp.]